MTNPFTWVYQHAIRSTYQHVIKPSATWSYEHAIRPSSIWTYQHIVRPVVRWPLQPDLNLRQRLLRGSLSYVLLPYLLYSITGAVFNLPYGIDIRRGPERPPAVKEVRPPFEIPFDQPLLIDVATSDKLLDLAKLNIVDGTVTFNAYSVKKTRDCQTRSPQQRTNRADFLKKYKKDCGETDVSITIPFLSSEDVNGVRANLSQYTTVVLTRPTKEKVYRAPVGPRSAVDFSVVGRQTPSGIEVVGDKENVRFLDGVYSEVFEQVPFRQLEKITPTDVQKRQIK